MKNLILTAILFLSIILVAKESDELSKAEVEECLREGHLDMLFPRTLDRDFGGFLCNFDCDWKPFGAQDKTLVYQSRTTWLASRAHMEYPEVAAYTEAAKQGFSCLSGGMWDSQNGGWWFKRKRNFSVPDEPEPSTKHAYGISFGIYACATYYMAFHDQKALDLAMEAFKWLEKNGHDSTSGGYFEFFSEKGSPINSKDTVPSLTDGKDNCIRYEIGYKSMNTHIHLLESFTSLYSASGDRAVRVRLEELRSIVLNKIAVHPGAMHMFFNPDWTPVPESDSFGHDMETAFLLLEASQALGEKSDPKTERMAKMLVDHSIDYGLDKTYGGYLDLGGTFTSTPVSGKIWWVQAEALNALFVMAKRYPEDKRNYWQLFLDQWHYIDANFIDHRRRGWIEFSKGAPEDNPGIKQSLGKCGYHDGRAMINILEGLKKKVSLEEKSK